MEESRIKKRGERSLQRKWEESIKHVASRAYGEIWLVRNSLGQNFNGARTLILIFHFFLGFPWQSCGWDSVVLLPGSGFSPWLGN